MDYRNFLRLEHDIHSYLMGISENGRIYNRSFEYTVRTSLMSIGIRVGFIHIEIEVETFMDENPIKMSVGEHLLYNGTYPNVNIYDCMDSHDKRIIEEIFKIVSNYLLYDFFLHFVTKIIVFCPNFTYNLNTCGKFRETWRKYHEII